MARELSAVLTGAMTAPETSQALLALITITHADIVEGPLRLVQRMTPLTSNGNVYTAFPFQIVLPQDGEDGRSRVTLMIDNVSQEIMAAVKALPPGSPPTVSVDLVLESDPDVVEFSLPELTLRDVSADLLVIEGSLMADEEDLNEFPRGSFTPQTTPGLFA